jgi:putative membrane protein
VKRFLNDEVKASLTAAIKEVELRTSAELVIAVRARSGTYRHVELITGAIIAFAALAFMLYAEHVFSIASLLIDPFLVGIVAGALATQIDPLHRLLTGRRARSEAVRVAAQSTFYENGVRMTTERTGLLIYLSLLERSVHVVADSGVAEAVDEGEWRAACAAIDAALTDAKSGPAVAAAIAGLGDILEPALPRSQFDVNELADEVDA